MLFEHAQVLVLRQRTLLIYAHECMLGQSLTELQICVMHPRITVDGGTRTLVYPIGDYDVSGTSNRSRTPASSYPQCSTRSLSSAPPNSTPSGRRFHRTHRSCPRRSFAGLGCARRSPSLMVDPILALAAITADPPALGPLVHHRRCCCCRSRCSARTR